MHKQKGFIGLAIIVLIFVITGGGVLLVLNNTKDKTNHVPMAIEADQDLGQQIGQDYVGAGPLDDERSMEALGDESYENLRAYSRDGQRLSDIDGLLASVSVYKDSTRQAPSERTYKSDLAVFHTGSFSDPLSGADYIYRNQDTNQATFYFQFSTELETSKGPAGVYCATLTDGVLKGPCFEK